MNMTNIIYQMLVLLLLIGTGYLCYKLKFFDDDFNKKLSRVIVYITTPAMIISSAASATTEDKKIVAYFFAIAIIMYALLPFIGIIINRILLIEKDKRGIYIFMTVFSNVGFMGFPVIRTIFGQQYVFYASIFVMIFNLLLYTLGVYLMSYGKNEKITIKWSRILNPGVIAALLAIIIYVFAIPVHTIIKETCEYIGGTTTPLAMMIIGATLASMPLKGILDEIKIYPYTIIKQLIMPVLLWLLLKQFITDDMILGVTLVVAAMPAGVTAVTFSNEYNGDTQLAAKGVFVTTVISFITIPLICLLLI